MNQSNNYSFNPMTGEPGNQFNQQQMQGQNISNVSFQQQVVQSTTNEYQKSVDPKQPKKNKKIIIIIVILIIIGIIVGLMLFINKDKNNSLNNNGDTSLEVENNDNDVETEESDLNESIDVEPEIIYDENGAFLFEIEDIFNITGLGISLSGNVERGTVKPGDTVQIIGMNSNVKTTVVEKIEKRRVELESAKAGDRVTLILRDVVEGELKVGQVIAQPDTMDASKKVEVDVRFLSEDEGGMSKPFFDNYVTTFKFRDMTDIKGTIKLPNDVKKVNPGDSLKFIVNLNESVGLEIGTKFTIHNDGHIIGEGKISKMY